jgi:large subunit ribosomal protein L10
MTDKNHSKTHISDAKKKLVGELKDLMNSKTVMVVSTKSLPDSQFQDIKKGIRDFARLKMARQNLIRLAMEQSGNEELKKLEGELTPDCILLFSDKDAFEISGILADSKSLAKAKPGQEAPEDIEIKAGPTDLIPGPDISALSAVGLQPKVENGKISVAQDAILCKAGEVISDEKASVLAKLGIQPFRIGLEPLAAFMDGKIYTGIKIDKEGFMEDLLAKYGRILPFAVEIGYVTPETLDFILAKANAYENALGALIKEDAVAPEGILANGAKEEDEKTEESPKEESEEKAGAEEVVEKTAEIGEDAVEGVGEVLEDAKEGVKEVVEEVAEGLKEIVEGGSE